MKKIVLILLALLLIAVCVLIFVRYRPDIALRNPPNAEKAKQEAIEYLENLVACFGEDKKTIKNGGEVKIAYIDDAYFAYGFIRFISEATEVSYVKRIPESTTPIAYIGEDMVGTQEKFYYTTPDGILAFTLSEPCSQGFILCLERELSMAKYPEIMKEIAEGIIKQLQDEMAYGEQDNLRFYNGNLLEIDVKKQKTLDLVFECIRNCEKIADYSYVSYDGYPIPKVKIGKSSGSLDYFHCTYDETGQFIYITFDSEYAESLREYVMNLK